MRKCIAAHTNPGADFPGFINFTLNDDGTVSVHVRGNPSTPINGIYICGYASRDKGKPGRCTPGDDHCNNYCNMAPNKGAMMDRPKELVFTQAGETVMLTLSVEACEAFAASVDRWHLAANAPRDGRHIEVCNGPHVPGHDFNQSPPMVVHYLGNPGEEGFYLSSGIVADSYNDAPVQFTHWREIGAGPAAL